jgi:hypothetical protein
MICAGAVSAHPTPTISFTDNVALGPVKSDTITISFVNADVKKYGYVSYAAICTTSISPDTYGFLDYIGSFTISDQTKNGKYVCAWGNNGGNKAVAVSANPLNIDVTAPTITITNPSTSPAQSKTITASASDGTLTMSTTTGSVCDGTLTFVAYSSQTFTSELDNGKKVCYKAVDAASNTAYSMSNAIAGIDKTAPIITVTGTNPITIEVHSTYTDEGATATDNLDPSVIVTSSGLVNNDAVGDYTLNYNAVDTAGNNAVQQSRVVHVVDTIKPVISSHDDVTAEATGALTTVTYTNPTATDNYDSSVTVTCSPVSGSTFALGDTIVTCNAKDSNNNDAIPTTFKVTITDTTAPTIDAITPIVAEATSASGATVTIIPPMSHDAVDGDVASSCDHSTGTFPIGTTLVTCTATDSHSNTGSASFNVVIQDTTIPVITLSGNAEVIIESGDAYTDAGATALDNIDGDITSSIVTVNPVDSHIPDTYTITYNVEDASKNSATQVTRTVIVQDTIKPTASITSPSADNHLKGTVTITADASDSGSGIANVVFHRSSVDPTIIGEDTIASYSVDWDTTSVADGNHDVWAVAYDNAGNYITSALVSVTVDNTAPLITTPLDMTKEATSSAGATVDYVASAADNIDSSVDVTCNPVSGSPFELGDTAVTCTATDTAGNTGTGTFHITVQDTTKPIVTLNGEANMGLHIGDTYTEAGATWTDEIDGSGTASVGGDTVNTLKPGVYLVKYDYTDVAGNHAIQVVRTVTVSDINAPLINKIEDITIEATDSNGAVVTYGPVTATDDVDGIIPATCTQLSGSTFELGDTAVTCTATDTAGNVGYGTALTVTITDTTAPSITAPTDITKEATGALTSVSLDTPTVSDIADLSPVVINDAPTLFPVGATTVTWTATDASGNHKTATQTVTITDTTPPTINTHEDVTPEAISPSGADVTFTATATDLVDGPVVVTCDPASGSPFVLNTPTTVTCNAADAHKNGATPITFTVTVKDTTAPTTSDDYGEKDGLWQNADQTITLTPADAASGVASTKYCTDSTNTCSPLSETDYTIPVIISTEGITYFRYASIDNAEHVQTTVSRTVKIDKTNLIGFTKDTHTPVDRQSTTDTTLDIDSKLTITTPITITESASDPNSASVGIPGLGKYIKIEAPDLAGNINSATIKVYYTDAEVSAAGLDESTLRLYYYDGANWIAYDGNDGIVPDGGVDTVNNYVWALTDHFSTWGIFGSTPAPATSSGGSSGGGGHNGGGSSNCAYSCAAWGACVNGKQTRTCTPNIYCDEKSTNKALTERTCTTEANVPLGSKSAETTPTESEQGSQPTQETANQGGNTPTGKIVTGTSGFGFGAHPWLAGLLAAAMIGGLGIFVYVKFMKK